jgi:hypothetical protein
MRVSIILIVSLSLFITACEHKHSYVINPNNIKRLEIVKQDDSVFRIISSKEYSVFAHYWNNAIPEGLTKYYAQIRIRVTLQNDTVLNFRASGASIKFNNDSTYNIGNNLYFQKLWENAR